MKIKQLPYNRFLTYRTEEHSLEKYKDWCILYALVADEAFQANSVFKNKMGGTGRWSTKDSEMYIFSVITGAAPTSFIFADNKSCHDIAIKEERASDVEYFKKWNTVKPIRWHKVKGEKPIEPLRTMMVLDSWNRNESLGISTPKDRKALLGFFNDEVKLTSGIYEVLDKDGNSANVTITQDNNIYSKLPKLMAEHIKYHVKINLVIYENLTEEDCSMLCRNVNLGVHWTPDLFRNTFTSPIAGSGRTFPVTYKKLLLEEGCKWFSPKQLSERKADAFFAELLWMYNNDFTKEALTPSKLDRMYAIGKFNEAEVKKMSAPITYFFDKIIKSTLDEFGAIRYLQFRNAISIMHLYHMFVPYYKNGYRILEKDLIPMFNNYFDIHSELVLSDNKYSKTKTGAEVLEPYSKLITGKQKSNAKICSELLQSNNKKPFNIENYLTKMGPRVISDIQKEALVHKQGNKTPEGKDIPANKVHTSDFEKGHGQTSYKDSLTVDIEDTYIQAQVDNRKQGSNPIKI